MASLLSSDGRRIKVVTTNMFKQTKDIKAGEFTPASFSAGSTIVQGGREAQLLVNLQPLVLIVDSEIVARQQLADFYTSKGCQVEVATSGEEALSRIEKGDIDLVVIDSATTDLDGVEVAAEIQFKNPRVSVIGTGYATIDQLPPGFRNNVSEYVRKSFSFQSINEATKAVLTKALEFSESKNLRLSLNDTEGEFGLLFSKTAAMHQVFETIRMVSPTNMTVLLEGEAGTGKRLIANAIHYKSLRRNGRFVPVNCAGFPGSLLETELFGSKDADPSGTELKRSGKIKLAHGGTLFLDEIEAMAPFVQSKLVRVLEDCNAVHIGGQQTLDSDVRVIVATDVPLQDLIAQGKMRPDLYYRINVVPIHLLPLRERADDIPFLVDEFLRGHRIANQKGIIGASRDTIARLIQYPWPGNIRELQNVLEKAVVLSKGSVIEDIDLPSANIRIN